MTAGLMERCLGASCPEGGGKCPETCAVHWASRPILKNAEQRPNSSRAQSTSHLVHQFHVAPNQTRRRRTRDAVARINIYAIQKCCQLVTVLHCSRSRPRLCGLFILSKSDCRSLLGQSINQYLFITALQNAGQQINEYSWQQVNN